MHAAAEPAEAGEGTEEEKVETGDRNGRRGTYEGGEKEKSNRRGEHNTNTKITSQQEMNCSIYNRPL